MGGMEWILNDGRVVCSVVGKRRIRKIIMYWLETIKMVGKKILLVKFRQLFYLS